MRNLLIYLFLCASFVLTAQELNSTVTVNAQQTGDENLQIFKTLEKQLNEFVNDTEWSSQKFLPQERIDCSFFLTIIDYSGENFTGTLQVQASRPVFGSTYQTSTYNVNDKDFSFQYIEFQNLIYNPNQYESNLVSVIAFHINMILGIDADTFSKNGGDPYFEQALAILNYSQNDRYKGWKLSDGRQTRFALIDDILSPTYIEYRDVMYDYHRNGLDVMSENPKEGKAKISQALSNLYIMAQRRPNAFLTRTFFDAKAEEIQDIFTDGPNVDVANLKGNLMRMAPTHASKWNEISY